MTTATDATTARATATDPTMDARTYEVLSYEVLRDRLAAQAAELARRAEALNAARIAAFGSSSLSLAGSGHLRTEDRRLPRDLVAVGDLLLFGSDSSGAAGLERAVGDPTARRDRLVHPYAPAEADRILSVLRHLLTARETVLAVNGAYITSAARSEASRTEPPFRLQGSYRDMNKIAARLSPAMNEAEL